MNKRIVAVLALLPILVLAASGFTLAHWDDEVEVTGSIALGTFNVTMSLEDFYDNEDLLDVGTVTASLYDVDDGDDIDGGIIDGLMISISNMYPGYVACVEFNIENSGTIPAELVAIDSFADYDFNWTEFGMYFSFELYMLTEDGYTLVAYLDNGTLISVIDLIGLTLDPGEAVFFKACFDLSADPNAPEDLMDETIEFGATLEFQQAVPQTGTR